MSTLKAEIISELNTNISHQFEIFTDLEYIILENARFKWMIGQYHTYPKHLICDRNHLDFIADFIDEEIVNSEYHKVFRRLHGNINGWSFVHLYCIGPNDKHLTWLITNGIVAVEYVTNKSSFLTLYDNHFRFDITLIFKNGWSIGTKTLLNDLLRLQQKIREQQSYRLLHRLSNKENKTADLQSKFTDLCLCGMYCSPAPTKAKKAP